MSHNPEGILDRFRPTLLLTRPRDQSLRFAACFRARFGADCPVVVSPLTEIRFLDPGALPREPDGVIFTSQSAVTAYARLTTDRTTVAWCVGARTAEAARAEGFAVRTGPGDAAGLVRTLAAGGGRMLYPRGTHVARDLTVDLNSAGIETISVVVYDQAALAPSNEAKTLLAQPDPVLLPLFSPRSARLAATQFLKMKAPLLVAAMSDAVADASLGLAMHRLQVASHPDAEAMLDALAVLIAAPNTA